MKSIPQQVREALQKTADESVSMRSTIALELLVGSLSDADAIKLRNLLR